MTDRADDGEAPGGGRSADAAGAGEVRERKGHRGHGGAPARVCELCGGPVLDRHCKIICLNCGYRRDCSDP